MGEIIFSICVGGCLVASGIIMLVVLKKEEERNDIR
ncbi:hypothetical protein Closa_3929 [[Clostridium] saccharolyticum WM1]|uniref:Uncharacterized protein n=1 Tax=Lacrimispora saccharolytica (strain ATCC 35040 / DSM 2544 / NRCC 2533 / WM1) TaxID=610130 RepID=D9R0L0_LACSW|nr:hypothetical protein Closa_3929 [[Clostridium] saccharolyticum WM1]